MRNLYGVFLCILLCSIAAKGQDDCSNPVSLCANSTFAGTNIGATTVLADPTLSCGPSAPKATVWYTVTALSNGTATVTVTNVDVSPGLTVEAFTGSCGSFVTTGQCASGTGILAITFAVTGGTVYYIMVSGRGSNTEAFNITATSGTNSIAGRPVPDFITTPPLNGCVPLSVFIDSSSAVNGTNPVFRWQFDGGPFINSSGADTTVVFSTVGTHSILLELSNAECGTRQAIGTLTVQDLVPSFNYSPTTSCVGTPIDFNGLASILPSPPVVSPNITSWDWDFGDPGSGVNNTANGQNVTHTFVGTGPFTVSLIVQGTCGPDTVTQVVNLLPKPVLHPSADQTICQGSAATISVTVDNATGTPDYSWSGPPSITCALCASTTITGLAPGGPYTYTINIIDDNGCVADSVTQITVNPTPVVNAGNDTTVCRNTSLTLNADVTTGTGPFTYTWTPTTGLSDPAIANPVADITGSTQYCVSVADPIGCTSAQDCININVFAPPTIDPDPAFFCTTDPGPYVAQFTVNGGGGAGSTYSWMLSPDYGLITGTNPDSSVITATFPTGVANTYSFTVIINNITTGCTDTITSIFPVIPGIDLTVSNDTTICAGSSADISASATGATYSWSATPAYTFADNTQPNQTVSPATTTTFIVTATNGVCSNTDSIVVTVNPKPVVDAGIDTTVCRYSPVQLNANVTSGTGPFTYSWSPSAGLSDPDIQNPLATLSSTSTFCVKATDPIGCASDSDCVTVNIYPLPTITSTHAPYCATDAGPDTTTLFVSPSGIGATYSWKQTSAINYIMITGANADSSSLQITLPPGITDSYVFTVIVTNPVTGCSDTVSTTLTVVPGITMTVSGSAAICSGDSVLLTASGPDAFAWTANPAYSFADASAQNQMVKPTVTTTFYVVGTTGTCTKTDSILVTVNPTPVAVAAPITPFCGCTTVDLDGTGSTANMKYTWTHLALTTLIADPNALTTTAVVCEPDVFTLTVTDTVTGCSDTAMVVAGSLPRPAAVANVNPAFVCSGTSTMVTLDGTGSNTDGGTTYSWTSSPPVSIVSPGSISTTATVTGTTVFFLTVTTTSGCDSIATDTVNVYPVPSITSSPGTVCTSGAAAIDTITINGAAGGSIYEWTVIPACVTPSSTGASSEAFDFSSCGVGSYPFQVVVTDAVTGCMDTLNTSVTVINGVSLTASPDQSICEGDSVVLFASGAATYIWSTGQTTDTIVLTGLTAAMSPDTIYVTGTVGGCSVVDTIIITINPTPVTDPINGPVDVCENDTATIFTVTDHPGNSYNWSVTNGTIASGQGTNTITVDWTGQGPAIVTVNESNGSCTGADQVLNVTVNPNPITPPVIGNTNVCANSGGVYFIVPDPNSTYYWSIVGGAITDSSNIAFGFVTVTWDAGPTGSISIVEVNAAGCAGDTFTLDVIISPAPGQPSIVGPDTVCEHSNGVIYNVTPTPGSFWAWFADGGATDISDSAQTRINWGAAGNGMVRVIETDSLGCLSVEDTLLVFIAPRPVPSAISGLNSVCENETGVVYAVDSTGNIYTWSIAGNGVIASGQGTFTITVDFAGAGIDSISVFETDPLTGCAGAVQRIAVTISPKPVTPPVVGPDTVCQNSTQQYAVVPNPGSSYQWFTAGGVIFGSSTDTIVSVMMSAAPEDTIRVVEISAAGCTGDTMSLAVTVVPAPAVPDIIGTDSLCAGATGVVYSVTNNAGNYYLWTVSGGTVTSPNDSTSSITVDWPTPGIDTIRVVEVNPAGCLSLEDTLIIYVDPVPTTTIISGPDSVCPGDSVLYTVGFTGGNLYTWTVIGGDTIAAGQGTDSIWIKWTVEGTDTIHVIETSPSGCAGIMQTLVVTVNHQPDSTLITGDTTACSMSTVTYYVTGDSASTFVWTATGGTIIGSNALDSVVVQWGTPGFGLLQVDETSIHGCNAAPAFLTVTIHPVPVTPPITGNDTVCISDTGDIFMVSNTVGSTYTWWLMGDTITSGQGTNSITVNWLAAGNDTIRVVETNSFGCAGDTASKIVNIHALPVANAFASKTTLCQNDTVHLTGVDSNGVSVNWYTNGTGTFDDTTSLTPIYTAGATDSGTVILIFVVHNAPCADDTATVTLTVNPVPHIVLTPPSSTICIGDTDTLTASATGTYIWSPGGETTSGIIVTPDSTTTYVVTVNNSFGCSSMDSVTVTVVPQGVANAGADQSICGNDSVFLDGTVANAGGGVWSSTGTGSFIPDATTLNATYVPGPADTVGYQLILTTTGACLNGSDTMNVLPAALPLIDAGADQSITYRDSAHLDGTANGAAQWSTEGTGFFIPDDTTLDAIYVPGYTDLQQDSVVLTLSSLNGCTVVTDTVVIYFSDFEIPNVITPYPNTPGYNDFFVLKGLPAGSHLKIWNRWGLLVFESENYRNDWDAADLVGDIYYYVIMTTKNEYHGWVKVIK